MRRQVTRAVVGAFARRETKRVANTSTDGNALFLHGNRIAEWRDSALWITTTGWPTVTTRERLNGLPGVRVSTARGKLYLNGVEWDGEWCGVDGGVR